MSRERSPSDLAHQGRYQDESFDKVSPAHGDPQGHDRAPASRHRTRSPALNASHAEADIRRHFAYMYAYPGGGAGMSTEAPTLYPVFRYHDARAAIEFLKSAFGFRERVVYANPDGTIAHAELSHGGGVLMLGSERADAVGARAGQGWLYVAVDDPDAHLERARAAGAVIVTELHDTDYGSREYAARDPEGNLWSLGTYRPSAEAKEPTTSAAAG
jgi:uncharacterized glyoxalase superfamily protein PhnB